MAARDWRSQVGVHVMTVRTISSIGIKQADAPVLAAAALIALLWAPQASFAACGGSSVGTGTHPPSTSTGVHTGATAPHGSTSSSSSSCATGTSNSTKLGNTANLAGMTSASPHVHIVHQSFAFQGKPNLNANTNTNTKPHRQ